MFCVEKGAMIKVRSSSYIYLQILLRPVLTSSHDESLELGLFAITMVAVHVN